MEEIKSLQHQVDEWIRTVGVRYFNELTNMAMLTEEVGEVARIIARRYGEQSEKESDKSKDLGEELADVLFVTLCLANQTGTDLQEAFNKKMKSNIFAILGLRSLYFALNHVMGYFYYLKYALAGILSFIGFKMCFNEFCKEMGYSMYISNFVSLGIILGLITISIIASVWLQKKNSKKI